jgi:hypothetical protein
MGALEKEIRTLLWEAAFENEAAYKALVTGKSVDVPLEDLIPMLLQKQQALEEAVLRVAGELDRLSGDTDE